MFSYVFLYFLYFSFGCIYFFAIFATHCTLCDYVGLNRSCRINDFIKNVLLWNMR